MGTPRMRLLVFAGLGAMCALLAGCTASPKDTSKKEGEMLSSAEAKGEVRELYEATKLLVGGDWIEDTRSWERCTTEVGDVGVRYHFYTVRASQPLQDRPENVAEQVRSVWREHGHAIDEITHNTDMKPPRSIVSDPPWLGGSAPNGSLFQVMVGTDFANYLATSRCVLGDLDALRATETSHLDDGSGGAL
ncbi:hypothetical protein ACFVWR_18560 [Leifsonia sp. NPDC058292]|uniref:hypothetical protein n=1 Tax=Leifsonia sp. NPDC058292 TaxID=3346428 RepID=UPI0036DBB2C8